MTFRAEAAQEKYNPQTIMWFCRPESPPGKRFPVAFIRKLVGISPVRSSEKTATLPGRLSKRTGEQPGHKREVE
jgi:hypothetical protein